MVTEQHCTLPHKVLHKVHMSTITFFVTQAKPPTPADPNVFFTDVPAVTIFVAQHGGMMGNDKVILAKTTELLDQLKDNGESIDESYIFTADYDPPFRLQHRHNEIWVAAAHKDDMHSTA